MVNIVSIRINLNRGSVHQNRTSRENDLSDPSLHGKLLAQELLKMKSLWLTVVRISFLGDDIPQIRVAMCNQEFKVHHIYSMSSLV